MRIGFRFFRRVGIITRGSGVDHEHVGMSYLPVLDSFLGVFDGFGQIISRQSETRHQKCGDT